MKRFKFFGISTALLLVGLALMVLMPGCGLLNHTLKNTVDPDSGSIRLKGLKADVTVRRDKLGIPVVEAQNIHDLAFGTGYAMASDRLAEMVSYSLLAQGRISEMVGPIGMDLDVYMRTFSLKEAAEIQYAALAPKFKKLLAAFSDGVNAYMQTHRDRLPLDFKMTGYVPEKWKPIDSMCIFSVLNLGLSFNVREEVAFLNLARVLGPMKAAWLFPVDPDEPLPFDKAEVLAGLKLSGLSPAIEKAAEISDRMTRAFGPLGVAASNNWGIAPDKTAGHASIICNDTHLPLEMPPIWMLLQLKMPGFHVAGIAMPGLPGIVAGYNGHIAWGMTMVMGDSQDIFLEKMKNINGKPHYLYQGKWLPAKEKKEIFHIKGKSPQERMFIITRHGVLLNTALSTRPKNIAIPPKTDSPYGLAIETTYLQPNDTVAGMYDLNFAETMSQAHDAIQMVRFMDLNFIYGDKNHIAWQVSGAYPIRKKGRGHLPSPGWTGDYDWTGYLPVDDYPYVIDPTSGYLCTANNRTIPAGDKRILGSSWYAPERVERIRQLLESSSAHTWKDCIAMQNDRVDLLLIKFKKELFSSDVAPAIRRAINAMPDRQKRRDADEALSILAGFNGDMQAGSSAAAVWGIFQNVFILDLFGDELGPVGSDTWNNFMVLNSGIYGPDEDHLLGRENSPFWDNIHTKARETKADILAESLADTIAYAKKHLGNDPVQWQWGKLHTYEWRTATTQMEPYLPFFKRFGAWLLSFYTDRGPYPAGGDFDTINVAGFHKGENFDVWLIPAMRMVVDFSRREPLFLVNSGGQSGNPASVHYDDGIAVWLAGGNRQMSFETKDIDAQYKSVFRLRAQ